MKKIIVRENLPQQNAEIHKVNLFINSVNKLIAKFKVDTGYQLAIPELLSLIYNGPDAVAVMHEKLKAFCQGQLTELKITSEMMRSSFLTGTGKYIGELSKALNAYHSSPGAQHLSSLQIVDGLLILPFESEEMIRDSFRIVITTEQAKKLLDLQNEAVNALQTLFDFIQNETVVHYTNVNHMVQNLFSSDSKSIQANDLDYDRITQKKKQTLEFQRLTQKVPTYHGN